MEEEKFRLTKYGILLCVCEDYNIDVSHITPKMAEHFFDDLIDALCRQGYAKKVEEL